MNDRHFVILDPCLESAGSHPLHFAMEVFTAATAAGFGCRLVANRRFSPHACPPSWKVAAAFTHTAYTKYNAYGALDGLDTRGRPPLLPRAPWAIAHAGRRREERIAAFAQDVAPTLASLRSDDVVLLATASELEVAGLARAIEAVRPPLGVGWHVLFHFPLYVGFAPDFPRQDRRLRPVAELLRQVGVLAAPHGLRWHATTDELATQYARLDIGPVDAVPYPIQPAQPRPKTSRPLRVACLGDARPEKGSQHLATAIERVLRECPAGELCFAVQTNLGFRAESRTREHRAVRASLARLEALAGAGQPVSLLGGPLDPAAYARELSAADAVLLPYDQTRYRARCSGVILESLAAGSVPIVTGGGWMARQLAEPSRRHVAAVVAQCDPLDAAGIESAAVASSRPLVFPLTPPPASRGRVAALAVDVTWRKDAAWIDEPPLRFETRWGDSRYATVMAATENHHGSMLLPVGPGATAVELSCAPWGSAPQVNVEAVRVRWLFADEPPPLSAVGIVIDSAGDVPAAVLEFVRHNAHYRDTAARHAPLVASAASATAFLERLLTAPRRDHDPDLRPPR